MTTEHPSLHPVDVLVSCWLLRAEEDRRGWTYADASRKVGLSQATLHASVMRCLRAQLLATTSLRLQRRRLLDFLTVAVPIVFYPVRGGLARGTLTAVVRPEEAPRVPYVWEGRGDVQGAALSPVHPAVPAACEVDPRLLEIFSLVDVLRVGGSASESARAVAALTKRVLEGRS